MKHRGLKVRDSGLVVSESNRDWQMSTTRLASGSKVSLQIQWPTPHWCSQSSWMLRKGWRVDPRPSTPVLYTDSGPGNHMKPPQKMGSFWSEKTGNYELPMKCQGSIYFSTYTFQFWRLPRGPSQIRYIPAVKLGIIKGIKKYIMRYEGFHVVFQLWKVRPGSISSWVPNFGTTGMTGSFRELAELWQAVFKSYLNPWSRGSQNVLVVVGWLVVWRFYALSASKAIFRARTYNCNPKRSMRLLTQCAI